MWFEGLKGFKGILTVSFSCLYGGRPIRQAKERITKANTAQAERERIAAQLAERERRESGHPALSKGEAQRRKLKTYQGTKCASGHDGERLTRNGQCVACRTADNSVREAMRRGAYPEDLTHEERDEIVAIYAKSRNITRESGIEHHVDHIIPLAAGGRHHPCNLQIITASANLKKGAMHNGVRHRRSNTAIEELELTNRAVKPFDFHKPEETETKGFWGRLRSVLF